MKFKNSFLALLLLTLVSCASQSTKPEPISTGLNKEFIKLDYFDSEVFDFKLTNALNNETKQVKLVILSPFNINNIPKRLDKWLSAVNQYQGAVDLQIDPDYPRSKGLLTEALDLIIMSYDAIKETFVYGAAENFNATVFYKDGEGTVTKVIFIYKK